MVKYLLLPGRIEHVVAFESFRRLYGGLDGQALASAIFGTYAATVTSRPSSVASSPIVSLAAAAPC